MHHSNQGSKNSMELERLLTNSEAAAVIGCTPATLRAWVSQGRVPVVRLSARFVRYDPKALREWIKANAVEPSSVSDRR